MLLKIACIALLALLPALACQGADKKEWFTLQACRYLADKSNDGDSFLVQCGQQRFFVRLYFVDAPEADAGFPERARQQYEYFGVTLDELTRAGARSRDYVQSVLQRPFVVHTKGSFAQGRSKSGRYYGLVQVDGGRYLHQVLLSEGLARNRGSAVGLPNGEKARAHVKALQALEDQARMQRRGVWGKSR